MTTLAMMNHKRHNPAIVLGVAFVACFLIALFTSHRQDATNDGSAGRPGFTLAAAPLLSSNRIADTKSFHRRSFTHPVAASTEPLFRSPASVNSEDRDVRLAASPAHDTDSRQSRVR